MLNVVFMGSDPIMIPLLDALVGSCSDQVSLKAIYTQPDRRTGRGMKLRPNEIKVWAQKHHVEIRQPEKPDEETERELRADGCDLLLVMAYGHLLRDSLLAIPEKGAVNFHASILPRLRGASPIETAMITGENEAGVSLMQIVHKMDSGPVADCEKVVIEDVDTRQSLREKLAAVCVPLLQRNLSALADGSIEWIPQDESVATYCRIIAKEDGFVDFSLSSKLILRQVHAFNPWPGAFFEYEGQRIRIGEARLLDEAHDSEEGKILSVDSEGLSVACGEGSMIKLLQLQRQGGRMMPADDFLCGFRMERGSFLKGQPRYPFTGSKPFRRSC